ncbi:MAG: hypothetical protein ACYC0X_16260 [Pirellulaceae bacterium]
MTLTSDRTRFYLYGVSIAAAEEFLTQGVLKQSYVVWIFTLIPFGLFLILASWLRTFLHRRPLGWTAPALYYVAMGTFGLAVEWFIIGVSPWSDKTSPRLLIVLFHMGMFSFWGTVALGPHILLDQRSLTATVRHAFIGTFVALMTCSYFLALAALVAGASSDLQFVATIAPVVLTFLSMNFIYVWYFGAGMFFRPSGKVIPNIAASSDSGCSRR